MRRPRDAEVPAVAHLDCNPRKRALDGSFMQSLQR